MALRSHSSTHGPSYICDRIVYGIGMLGSTGLFGGQAYQLLTQDAGSSCSLGSQGWIGLAGIVGCFAISSFALIRSTLHQSSEQDRSYDGEQTPLLTGRVAIDSSLPTPNASGIFVR